MHFSDDSNEYFFNFSKSVLQRKFYIPQNAFEINIKIIENPFLLLLSLKDRILNADSIKEKIAGRDYVILPLYSVKNGVKEVPSKSGLNQWNAGGRARNYGEVYIQIPAFVRNNFPNFFPPRDSTFILKTPNNENLNVKVCQQDSKALMSNPNTALSTWLLQTALNLKVGELATYKHLENLGFDSVIVSKDSNGIYSIDIASLDSYDKFVGKVKQN
ncbi:restriction endonuclease PLD domain-containing protein [Helicobacter saguini]|uniref:restriction endonuclease PLD domain-containing protein n=1 Tax=Helicobacter saguini TaxID=1548018 RepID=UPI00068CF5A2|nr:restriction endonuclease PLD domain-containing protein [Helicobacter saguini]